MKTAQLSVVLLFLDISAHFGRSAALPAVDGSRSIGELPPQLRESSGLAASRDYPDRLYHINDSGDAGRFYLSRFDGTGLQTVPIAAFKPSDVEALSLGPCPGTDRGVRVFISATSETTAGGGKPLRSSRSRKRKASTEWQNPWHA